MFLFLSGYATISVHLLLDNAATNTENLFRVNAISKQTNLLESFLRGCSMTVFSTQAAELN
jgi:hypothetical protein